MSPATPHHTHKDTAMCMPWYCVLAPTYHTIIVKVSATTVSTAQVDRHTCLNEMCPVANYVLASGIPPNKVVNPLLYVDGTKGISSISTIQQGSSTKSRNVGFLECLEHTTHILKISSNSEFISPYSKSTDTEERRSKLSRKDEIEKHKFGCSQCPTLQGIST